MNDWLYRKEKNGRYVKTVPFEGFPCDGIWLVISRDSGKSHTCICQLEDLNHINLPMLTSINKRRDQAIKKLAKRWENHGLSISDMFDIFAKEISVDDRDPKPMSGRPLTLGTKRGKV